MKRQEAEEELTAPGFAQPGNYSVENILEATSALKESNPADRRIIYEILGQKVRASDNFEDENDEEHDELQEQAPLLRDFNTNIN